MLHFHEHAQSKCGTFDYLDHRPGGGDKKVFFYCLPLLFLVHFPIICLWLYTVQSGSKK